MDGRSVSTCDEGEYFVGERQSPGSSAVMQAGDEVECRVFWRLFGTSVCASGPILRLRIRPFGVVWQVYDGSFGSAVRVVWACSLWGCDHRGPSDWR